MTERDDRLDARIRHLAVDYNAPPEPPRAEMWERIRAVRSRSVTRRPVRWFVWPVAAAAMLVIGVGIGRLTVHAPNVPAVASNGASTVGAEAEGSALPVAYRLAADQHLSHVETFLSVFSVEASSGHVVGRDLEPAARQLLQRTRLLQDSPIARDVAMRQLLDDVELVLVQIAAYAHDGDKGDLGFIEQGIEGRSMLLRLRSVQSNQADRAATQGVL